MLYTGRETGQYSSTDAISKRTSHTRVGFFSITIKEKKADKKLEIAFVPRTITGLKSLTCNPSLPAPVPLTLFVR